MTGITLQSDQFQAGTGQDRVLFALNVPGFITFGLACQLYPPFAPHPKALRVLYGGPERLVVTRTGERTLRISAPHGFNPPGEGRFFRSPTAPMHAGERVQITWLSATVRSVDGDAMPLEVDFELPVLLEDPLIQWKMWDGFAFQPWMPPRLGETVQVGPPSPAPPA